MMMQWVVVDLQKSKLGQLDPVGLRKGTQIMTYSARQIMTSAVSI